MAAISQDLAHARTLLMRGQPVAIPTETVYGLAANALDEAAVIRTYDIKQRPRFNPLIVHAHSLAQVEAYSQGLSTLERQLLEAYAPGPLTLLLPKNERVPDLVTAGSPLVGIRLPRHPLTQALLRELPFPLTAPSANPFGKISPTRPEHVQAQLGGQIELILDGGPCELGIESTVVRVEAGQIHVFREGALTREQLSQHAPVQAAPARGPLHAPGRVKYHYAPDVPTYLYRGQALPTDQRIGMLCFQKTKPGIPPEQQWVLAPNGDLSEAGRQLFRYLNELNREGFDAIYLEPVPETGIGRAINEKMRKAAARYE